MTTALSPRQVRARVRDLRLNGNRMLAVLDDDPTGSQSVHGVQVVTVFDRAEYAQALPEAGSTCFVLTNTRGLPERDAVDLTTRIADQLFLLAAETGRPVDIVSRGDSTLRGHVIAEVTAIAQARRRFLGSSYDVILFAPAFFEAGRTTVDDVHRVRLDGVDVPASDTEFARDATFGFRSSDLKHYLAEKSGGAVDPGEIESISLTDIREGGAESIADRLVALRGGRWVVVNAETADDYDTVGLAVALAQSRGTSVLVRSAPSFVRSLAGIDPAPPLGSEQIWADGRRPGNGLIVVGSHVSGTSAQVEALRGAVALAEFELEVESVLGPDRDATIARLGSAVVESLGQGPVLLATSRRLVASADADASLAIARSVSSALTAVVHRALDGHPAWVVAKGGITSHDVAVAALGIRRAEVVGQLGPGIISLLRPLSARSEAVGMPYVVFAGNVGGVSSLADVVAALNS